MGLLLQGDVDKDVHLDHGEFVAISIQCLIFIYIFIADSLDLFMLL